MEKDILNHISQVEHMAYAVCNASREITYHSSFLSQFATPEAWHEISTQDLLGQPVEHLFDELVGLEPDLDLVRRGKLGQLRIDMAARTATHLSPPVQYITLKVYPFPDNQLLITVFDMTQPGLLAQKLVQQRNEFYLMLNQLHYLHTEMDGVLKQYLSFNASIFQQPPTIN